MNPISVKIFRFSAAANLCVKGVYFVLAGIVLCFPDLPQFAGKAMSERLGVYSLGVFAIPFYAWLALRKNPGKYPHGADVFFTLPFIIDLAGNAFNCFDTIRIFDDITHFTNWMFLVMGFALMLGRHPFSRLNLAGLAIGFGASTHILWEIGEFAVMKLGSSRLHLTYEDTIGDLITSFAGTVAGALSVAFLKKNRQALAGMVIGVLLMQPCNFSYAEENKSMKTIYDFKVQTIDGQEKSLADFKGKVLLVVNTASKCGFTPQYKGLEELYQKYKAQGFEVLGFPANNFMNQEPGTDAEIKSFCELKYKTTFPLFSKISVKGKDIHLLYAWLTSAPGLKEDISWNFNKFLIDRSGMPVAHFGSRSDPFSKEVVSKLEQLLAAAPH